MAFLEYDSFFTERRGLCSLYCHGCHAVHSPSDGRCPERILDHRLQLCGCINVKQVVNDDNDNINYTERHNSSFSQSLHCVASCFQHVRSSGQGAVIAYHMQHNECTVILCNVCYMM